MPLPEAIQPVFRSLRLGLLCLAAWLLLSPVAADPLPSAYREGPYYKDLMGDVARLRLFGNGIFDTECTRDIASPKPCPELKHILDEIIEKNGLPAGLQTAEMLKAYADGNYRKADRLYAAARGYALPEELQDPVASTVGGEVAALGVVREEKQDTSCTNDLYGAKPCLKAMQAFEQFARERGLAKSPETVAMFYAYVEGDQVTGDRLYASVTGTAQPVTRNELLAEVKSYNVPPEEKKDTSCSNDYYASKPCLAAVAAWRDFSRKHGLELTPQTAQLFRAYLEGDEVTGDKLYAAAKGISVAELLHDRGVPVDLPSDEPLYVPIHP